MTKPPKGGSPSLFSSAGVPIREGALPPGGISNALQTITVSIDEIRPYSRQLRRRSRRDREKLKTLVERYGQVRPVLLDADYVVIDGHALLEALKGLGRAQVLVTIVHGLGDAEVKGLRLAINRLPEDAAWDDENVRHELTELLQLGFELDLTGFDPVEIDHHLEIDIPKLNGVEDDDAPLREANVVSRSGDVWLCGGHRVGCGDATDADFIRSMLGEASADMCFVDPPYNIQIGGFASGKGKTEHREFVQASGEMTEGQFTSLLTRSLGVLASSSSQNALIYACMDWRHLYELLSAGRQCGLKLSNLCVWAKTNAGMGSFYRSQHEHVAVFRAGADAHLNNVELGRHGRNRSNLWTYRGMNSFGRDRDAALAAHPTVKPVLLVADAIRDCTRRGQIVLDTFLGSGSTLIAAEETGRLCVGCDLDPGYLDVCVRRWQARTRQDAVHAVSHRTFEEHAEAVLQKENGGGDA
jgi:DNA modification methylase